MDFHSNELLYNKHDKCKYLKEKKKFFFMLCGKSAAMLQYSSL